MWIIQVLLALLFLFAGGTKLVLPLDVLASMGSPNQIALPGWFVRCIGVAEVLFGDYNPAGRLPVTFYKAVEQLPPFESYAMEGRTYRYFKGQPLYPFGHGLSYTRFKYSGLNVSSPRVSPTDKVTVSATVENVGRVEGDEVVQLYVTDEEASVRVPVRSLAGVERVRLKSGERRVVSFTIDPRQLAVIRDDGRAFVEPGEFRVSVGGKQPGFAGTADAATTSFVEGRFTTFLVSNQSLQRNHRGVPLDAPKDALRRGVTPLERGLVLLQEYDSERMPDELMDNDTGGAIPATSPTPPPYGAF